MQHGIRGAVFLAYLAAQTTTLSGATELGKAWVTLTMRQISSDLNSSKNTWSRVIAELVEKGVIERRERGTGINSGHEYYYRNEHLTNIVERLKLITRRIHGWSNGVKGTKLTREEHEEMTRASYLALERGEPVPEIIETIKVYLTMTRKGRNDVDYLTARYIAIEKKDYKEELKNKDTSPTRPRPREVTA